MSFDYSKCRPGKKILLQCVALLALLLLPTVLYALDNVSYAQEIRKYVDEDKVYLLENIRQKVTRKSEQIVIEAILSEDGPQAFALYRKQLREYPDPAIDPLSSSRIAAYNLLVKLSPPAEPELSASLPIPRKLTPELPDTTKQSVTPRIGSGAPAQPKTAGAKDTTKSITALRAKALGASLTAPKEIKNMTGTGTGTCTLQFGSFSNRENAETLLGKMAGKLPVEIVLQGRMHKVQLKTNYTSHEEAIAAAKKLPFDSIVVPVR
ncbi:MAG: SPOR domain-containing protein [Chlorobiaceae bacterium]|nr:SPOR domain-containing protein [Chlorobiaceae bacterium]